MGIESKIKNKVSLSHLTTLKIGGEAKFFLETDSLDELIQAINWAKNKGEHFFILAGGSNILVNDSGVDGLVIKFVDRSLLVAGNKIECGAGASLSKIVKAASDNNLSGLEWAAGIPGTIGGAVRGNAGAFESEMGDVIKNVKVFNAFDGDLLNFNKKQCSFSYRNSVFKQKNNLIITRVFLIFKKGEKDKIKELMNKYITYRNNTQPKEPSAGSIFKNLVIEKIDGNNVELAGLLKVQGAIKDGRIGAGWFIDRLGLKGKMIGGAKISEKHANFIINTGNATAEDVATLISFIKQQARDRFGIQLQEEIQYLGF